MVCTYCGGATQVVNSRLNKRTNRVWRRRRCKSCEATFSTEEAVRLELAWHVKDGSRSEPFSRDKLFLSLYRSCGHRKTVLGDAEGLTDTVIRKLSGRVEGGMISKDDITGAAQVALNRFDQAASVHYAAHHKG